MRVRSEERAPREILPRHGDQTATEGVPGHRNIGCRAEKVGGSGCLLSSGGKESGESDRDGGPSAVLAHAEFGSGGVEELQVTLSGASPRATNKSQRKLAKV